MSQALIAVGIFGVFVVAGLIGATIGKLDTRGHWHERWLCKCGHHDDNPFWKQDPCKGCGEYTRTRRKQVMRWVPWRWEIKPAADKLEQSP